MLEIKYVMTEKLRGFEKNSRTHTQTQIDQIRKSMREFGFTNPILIDENCWIIAGHGRLEAAKLEDMVEVPTITLTDLTKEQKKAYVIADNQIPMNAGWDMQLLSVEIGELKDLKFDTSLLGFSNAKLESIMNDELKPEASVSFKAGHNIKVKCESEEELAELRALLEIEGKSIEGRELITKLLK